MKHSAGVAIVVTAILAGIVVIALALNYNGNNSNNMSNAELKIEDVEVGTGPAAKSGDLVTVHYVGTFSDDTEFDSSRKRGEPFSFVLGTGTVIKGWDEGVAGMQIGSIRKLIVPPALGYGEDDFGPIPGGSTLYFEVELLEIGS